MIKLIKKRKKKSFKGFQVNKGLTKSAKKNFIFLHNEIVTKATAYFFSSENRIVS